MTRARPKTPPMSNERLSVREAEKSAMVFKTLGNINRLRIMLHLGGGERSVREIETQLDIRQPTLSQQLRELREAGLILGRRTAKSAIYGLAPDRGQQALELIACASGCSSRPDRQCEPHPQPAGAAQGAAMFASVIPLRRTSAGDPNIGF